MVFNLALFITRAHVRVDTDRAGNTVVALYLLRTKVAEHKETVSWGHQAGPSDLLDAFLTHLRVNTRQFMGLSSPAAKGICIKLLQAGFPCLPGRGLPCCRTGSSARTQFAGWRHTRVSLAWAGF